MELAKKDVLRAVRKRGISSRQIDRWIAHGLLPQTDRRSPGYKGGVRGYLPAEVVKTAVTLSEFLRQTEDLDAAGRWAWWLDCPVPPSTVRQVLYRPFRENWRDLRRSRRIRTRADKEARIDSIADRYRYRVRRLVGGNGQHAYQVAYQLLALAARSKTDQDLTFLLDSLRRRIEDSIRGFGTELTTVDFSAEFVKAVSRLSLPLLARTIRKATSEELEGAKEFLKSHLQVVVVAMLLSGFISPASEPRDAIRVLVNQLPIFIAGVILLQQFMPDALVAMPPDPPELAVPQPGAK